MLCPELDRYLANKKTSRPFFYVVGDKDYGAALDVLRANNFKIVHMSDFGVSDDRFPSVDLLAESLRLADIDCRASETRQVIVGFGELLSLRGMDFAQIVLGRFVKNVTIGAAKVVFLLRGAYKLVEVFNSIVSSDPRLREQSLVAFSSDRSVNVSITIVREDVGLFSQKGVKSLLKFLEDDVAKGDDAKDDVRVSTNLSLDCSLFPTKTFDSAYDAVKLAIPSFSVSKECGSEEMWKRLLKDLKENGNDLEEVFKEYDVEDRLRIDFRLTVTGTDYGANWIPFLYQKLHSNKIENDYERYVVDTTDRFDDFKNNLLTAITRISTKEENFPKMYKARKRLLEKFTDEEELGVIVEAIDSLEAEERIRYFTDNTLLEKQKIMKWISAYGLNSAIGDVYPELADYLREYELNCHDSELARKLTEYFNEYKRLKVSNRLTDDFVRLVEEYANNNLYAFLQTRDNAVKSAANSKAFLYWIDALGVEYLSFIASLAKKHGLSMSVEITRAELPTFTSKENTNFYAEWTGAKFKEEELDAIKHKKKGNNFFDYTKDKAPIHLPTELEVVKKAVERAVYELRKGKFESFIITSDHGASRLAVIKEQELPRETDTKGEHSGRCCVAFDGCDVPFYQEGRADGKDYIVLADYGRFKGSRAANVEVHGGASLEEVVVPVIKLKLAPEMKKVKITLLKPDEITASRSGAVLTISISRVTSSDGPALFVEGERVQGVPIGDGTYQFTLTKYTRATQKPVRADVYDGGNQIDSIEFNVKGKAAAIREDFDFDEDF